MENDTITEADEETIEIAQRLIEKFKSEKELEKLSEQQQPVELKQMIVDLIAGGDTFIDHEDFELAEQCFDCLTLILKKSLKTDVESLNDSIHELALKKNLFIKKKKYGKESQQTTNAKALLDEFKFRQIKTPKTPLNLNNVASKSPLGKIKFLMFYKK